MRVQLPCVQEHAVMGADPAVSMASAGGHDGLLPLRACRRTLRVGVAHGRGESKLRLHRDDVVRVMEGAAEEDRRKGRGGGA